MQPWRFSISIIVAGAAGASALAAPPADSTQLANTSTTSPAPAVVRWKPHTEKGKLATFSALAKSLEDGTAHPSVIEACQFLVSEPQRRDRMSRWCALLDGPRRGEAFRMLYAELMLADSDPDLLFESCIANVDRTFKKALADPLNYGAHFSWGMSRPMMACITGFQATGQQRFLEVVADAFERILPLRDSELGRVDEVRGRSMHSWGTNRYSDKHQYRTDVCTAGRITYPLARWIQIVRQDSQLRETYAERADRYLALIRQTMDEYEVDYKTVPGTNQGYYLHQEWQLAEALNHMSWAGNCLLTLGKVTGEMKYSTMAEGIANYMKASMTIDERGCLVWAYMPQPAKRSNGREWVWKAATTIDLPLFFANQHVIFTDNDLERIARTFLTNIHQGPDQWNAQIEHTFIDLFSRQNPNGELMSLTHFIDLGDHDPRVREQLEELIATRPEIGGWFRGSNALMAYAYRLIRPGFNDQRSAESLRYPPPSKPRPSTRTSEVESTADDSED